MGATRVYETQFQKQESKIFAFLESSAIIPLISQETNSKLRENLPIIKPLPGGFIIFIGAFGEASFELFRVPDESHNPEELSDI